jgi:hypothetical protein
MMISLAVEAGEITNPLIPVSWENTALLASNPVGATHGSLGSELFEQNIICNEPSVPAVAKVKPTLYVTAVCPALLSLV